MLSLYFHIPFCSRKCPYCHFYSVAASKPLETIFLSALALEWEMQLPQLLGQNIVSIYFGGGTPTQIDPGAIGRILMTIQRSAIIDPNCEITIEANPENLGMDLLQEIRDLGVNRISIGAQSFDDAALKVLERPHSAKKAIESIHNAQKAGFDNISIDLMYDLPGQTRENWKITLDALESLPITHLSLYNLIIEPHTPFFRKKNDLAAAIPKDERSLELLQMAIEQLEKLGFYRYEISAFAKNGFISRHNCGYWTGRPFLGYGPSAFSYWNGRRFQNASNLHRYSKALEKNQSPVCFEETLPYPANVHELFAIGLRLFSGVEESKYPLPLETVSQLKKLQSDGFLQKMQDRWQLTEKGKLFYDTVAEEIIS